MLAKRLGVQEEQVSRIAGLDDLSGQPDILFDRAFAAGPTEPESAKILLASAILGRAQETPEGRLKSALCLLARLVAQAPVKKTLGPSGRSARDELMPSGWKETTKSWPKLRYAWREGLADLLDPQQGEFGTVEALDELTRMHGNEPDPVPVAIHESFPSPPVAFAISLLGTILAVRGVVREIRSKR